MNESSKLSLKLSPICFLNYFALFFCFLSWILTVIYPVLLLKSHGFFPKAFRIPIKCLCWLFKSLQDLAPWLRLRNCYKCRFVGPSESEFLGHMRTLPLINPLANEFWYFPTIMNWKFSDVSFDVLLWSISHQWVNSCTLYYTHVKQIKVVSKISQIT